MCSSQPTNGQSAVVGEMMVFYDYVQTASFVGEIVTLCISQSGSNYPTKHNIEI
jgi:hypothetical protein